MGVGKRPTDGRGKGRGEPCICPPCKAHPWRGCRKPVLSNNSPPVPSLHVHSPCLARPSPGKAPPHHAMLAGQLLAEPCGGALLRRLGKLAPALLARAEGKGHVPRLLQAQHLRGGGRTAARGRAAARQRDQQLMLAVLQSIWLSTAGCSHTRCWQRPLTAQPAGWHPAWPLHTCTPAAPAASMISRTRLWMACIRARGRRAAGVGTAPGSTALASTLRAPVGSHHCSVSQAVHRCA